MYLAGLLTPSLGTLRGLASVTPVTQATLPTNQCSIGPKKDTPYQQG